MIETFFATIGGLVVFAFLFASSALLGFVTLITIAVFACLVASLVLLGFVALIAIAVITEYVPDEHPRK